MVEILEMHAWRQGAIYFKIRQIACGVPSVKKARGLRGRQLGDFAPKGVQLFLLRKIVIVIVIVITMVIV